MSTKPTIEEDDSENVNMDMDVDVDKSEKIDKSNPSKDLILIPENKIGESTTERTLQSIKEKRDTQNTIYENEMTTGRKDVLSNITPQVFKSMIYFNTTKMESLYKKREDSKLASFLADIRIGISTLGFIKHSLYDYVYKRQHEVINVINQELSNYCMPFAYEVYELKRVEACVKNSQKINGYKYTSIGIAVYDSKFPMAIETHRSSSIKELKENFQGRILKLIEDYGDNTKTITEEEYEGLPNIDDGVISILKSSIENMKEKLKKEPFNVVEGNIKIIIKKIEGEVINSNNGEEYTDKTINTYSNYKFIDDITSWIIGASADSNEKSIFYMQNTLYKNFPELFQTELNFMSAETSYIKSQSVPQIPKIPQIPQIPQKSIPRIQNQSSTISTTKSGTKSTTKTNGLQLA